MGDMEKRLVTVDDLQLFKMELLREFKRLLQNTPPAIPKPWLKSHELQKMLKISAGTLQHLRDSGQLKFSRVGGLIFYEMKDVEEMVNREKGE